MSLDVLKEQPDAIFSADEFEHPSRQIAGIKPENTRACFVRRERNKFLDDVFTKFDKPFEDKATNILYGRLNGHRVKLSRYQTAENDVVRSLVFIGPKKVHGGSIMHLENAVSVIEAKTAEGMPQGIYAEKHRDDVRGSSNFIFDQEGLDESDFVAFGMAGNTRIVSTVSLGHLVSA